MSLTATIETVKVTATVDGDNITASFTSTPIEAAIGGLVYIDGDVNVYRYTAGVSLSAIRAVCIKSDGYVYYASRSDQSTRNVQGITISATTAGQLAPVQIYSVLEDNSWSWTPGAPVYVGLNGLLTQTAPTSGYICQVGIATKATEININVQQPIVIG